MSDPAPYSCRRRCASYASNLHCTNAQSGFRWFRVRGGAQELIDLAAVANGYGASPQDETVLGHYLNGARERFRRNANARGELSLLQRKRGLKAALR